jgi:uncharacterized membrane protein
MAAAHDHHRHHNHRTAITLTLASLAFIMSALLALTLSALSRDVSVSSLISLSSSFCFSLVFVSVEKPKYLSKKSSHCEWEINVH